MMNVKFVRVKVTKSEFFSFFFFFENFLTSCHKKRDAIDKNDECGAKRKEKGKKRKRRDEKKGAVQKKKESILLVGLLRIFVLVTVTDFTCRG